MDGQGDSIVLEEEIDPNYEPTEKEVLEYATWLGMDLEVERDLFWIAREGLKAPLPENWKPCKTTDTEEIYYFNFTTGQSTWDHPCDEFYRNLYEEHKKKHQKNDEQETDEKKKKVKEDVAELLGRKSSKKKKSSLAKAEPLGGSSLGKANALEKKPLLALSGRLGTLGSSGLSGGLKPVAGLGHLKSDTGGSNVGLDSTDGFNSDAMTKPLSRGPLGTVLGKKPLPSSPSVDMSESKPIADMTSNFKEKRDKLAQEHAVKLREVQDGYERELETLRQTLKAQMEDVQDAEEMKFKQLKRELDKKKHDLENQFDREENALQRKHKDQLKRLEGETEDALSQKKRDLDCELKSEIDKIQLKNEAKQQEIQKDWDQEAEKLTERMKIMLGDKKEAAQFAIELKTEVERLKDLEKSHNKELTEVRNEKDLLLQDKEKHHNETQREMEELRRQLSEGNHSESSAIIPQECTKCTELDDQVSNLKIECDESKEQLEKVRKEFAVLQQELETRISSEGVKSNAVEASRDQEGILKQEIVTLQQQLTSFETDSREWRSKCAALQYEKDAVDQIQTSSASESQQVEALQKELLSYQSEVADVKTELSDLQDEHAVTQMTNAQIKEQLMKEGNEGKTLREQLDSKTEEVTKLTTELEECQHQLQALQQQLESELQTRRDQEDSCEAQRKYIEDLEQAKSTFEAELDELKREKRDLKSEVLDGSEEMMRLIGLKEEINWLNDQLRSLQEEVKTVRSDKETLLQTKSVVEMALAEAQHDVEELQQQLAEASRPDLPVESSKECLKCSVWENRVSSLESDYTEAQIEVEKLKKELLVIKEDTEVQIAADRESARAAAAVLKREKDDALNVFREQESLLRREIVVLQEKITALEAESRSLRATRDSLQSEIDTTGRQQSDMSCSVSATQEQLKKLQHQLGAAQTEVLSTSTELHDLQTQYATILSTNNQMKEQLTNESKAQKLLREQLDVQAEEAEQHLKNTMEKHQQQMLSVQQQLENESRTRREQEDACDSLRKQINVMEQAKRKHDTEFGQLESDKRHLEAEKSILMLRLDELSKSRKRDEKSVVSVEEALADKKLEAAQLRANWKVSETDKEHLETRLKVLNQEYEQLLAKTHRLEAEYENERVQCRAIEKERDTVAQKQHSLVDELETSQRKSRTLVSEVSEVQNLLNKAIAAEKTSSNKVEELGQKIRLMEQHKERDDFVMKLKLQQVEVERENIVHAKERAEQQLRTREKELISVKDENTSREKELESLQARVKSLLSDKEDVQAALLNANMANAASASANRESANSITASTDVMLVKLQLADANRNELELHLADISSQLEQSTRRCVSLEGRCRDQTVEIESLHVEVASLRSASQKVHLSALESLVLVERLEYEHKKRNLKSDFLNQLRDFQEREEKVLVRHKARLRAQYERHLEDLVAELEKLRQQRVEQEEALSMQMIEQIRQERDVKRTEAKRKVREELKQFEQELHERKTRDLEIISKAVEREEDELGAKLREVRQVAREEELLKQSGREKEREGTRDRLTLTSSSQTLNRLHTRPESLDEDCDDNFQAPATRKQTKSSNQLQHSKSFDRRQKQNLKSYQKWKQRLQDEVELLGNARTLVSNQRKGLMNQAQQLKASKNEWKRNSRSSKANPIQREVKRMLDENMANWSEGMRKLRKQESWIKQREEKLAKMKRTVNRLKTKRTKFSYNPDNNLSGGSESSSSEDGEERRAVWSDYSNESELASTLEKLEKLEEELASDTGSFSDKFPREIDDAGNGNDFHALYRMPQSYALEREAAYRYPLSSSLGLYTPRRTIIHSTGDPPNHDMRFIRSQRTAFGLRGDRFAVTSTPISANRTEQVYQQKISRWAKGREKMQHAATNHATWLSGLCDELKEYGAKYTRMDGELGDVDDGLEFLPDERGD